jgi:excisionase family DNA binding protein
MNHVSVDRAIQNLQHDRLLTALEIEKRYGHPDVFTIRRWIAKGHLRAAKVGKFGRYLIRESEIRRLLFGGDRAANL